MRAFNARSRRTEIDIDQVLRELGHIGFSNMLDFVTIGDDGRVTFDLTHLSRDQAAAIQEIVVDEYTEGAGEDARNVKRTRFKLANKVAALEKMGKHLGMFTERHDHVVEHIDREERIARIFELLQRLGIDPSAVLPGVNANRTGGRKPH